MTGIQAQTVRFVDIPTGSQIRVSDALQPGEHYDATVLQVQREAGRTAIPALLVRRADGEEVLVMSSGRWKVEVLADGNLASGATEGAHRLRHRPVEVSAKRFAGGVDSAIDIVRWLRGRVSYAAADETLPELLRIDGGNSVAVAGDWIVLHSDNRIEVLDDAEVLLEYELIE